LEISKKICFGFGELPFNSGGGTEIRNNNSVLSDVSFDNINASKSDNILIGSDNLFDKNNQYFNINTQCKYYSVEELHKIDGSDNNRLSIFHNNINGLENKFEHFQALLSSTIQFDIISLTD